MLVVSGPGIVSAGMHNRQRPSHHRRAKRAIAHALQYRLVPLNDNGWTLGITGNRGSKKKDKENGACAGSDELHNGTP